MCFDGVSCKQGNIALKQPRRRTGCTNLLHRHPSLPIPIQTIRPSIRYILWATSLTLYQEALGLSGAQ
jgi:hypothetical protein